MSTSRKAILRIVLLSVLFMLLAASNTLADDECDTISMPGAYTQRPSIGADTVLAIWCASHDISYLPSWWDEFFDQDDFYLGGYFTKMSDTAYSLVCDSYCDPGGGPFRLPETDPPLQRCALGSNSFGDSILILADPYIDFADYDKNGDGTVDGLFFMIITDNVTGGCNGLGISYQTNDTLPNGQRVWVHGEFGVEVRLVCYGGPLWSKLNDILHTAAHEWGHQFGLEDYRCCGCNPKRTLGTYSVMGYYYMGNISPPYDPYTRKLLGWIDPIQVTTDTLYDHPIPDLMSTGELYQLGPFLVANHVGTDPPNHWETGFPGQGLLIYHTAPGGTMESESKFPMIDIESAHGMWDFSYVDSLVRDDSTGTDSLGGGFGLGFVTDFWNENSTRTAFDDTSSPNTRNYTWQEGSPDFIKQTIPTGIWVRDIQGLGGDTIWADMYSPMYTWGPGEVHLNGDYTIDSGVTLQIYPGTEVYFDTNDATSGGYDTTKCEFIVKGRLVANGIFGEPSGDPGGTILDYMINFASVSADPQAGDWYGIVVEPGGIAKLMAAEITDAYCGISFDYSNDPMNEVSWCGFDNNQVYAIKSRHSEVLIKENDITGPTSGYGIYIDNPKAEIRSNVIMDAEYGIYIRAVTGASTIVEDNEIMGTGYRGMHIQDVLVDLGQPTATTIEGNLVDGYFSDCLAYLNNANLMEIDQDTLQTGPSAVTDTSRSPTGMKIVDSDDVKIRDCVIKDYRYGGVVVYNQSDVDLGVDSLDSGNNYIATSSIPTRRRAYAVVNQGIDTLKAEDNYWGTDSPPDTMFSGPIDYDPWLSAPPGQGKIPVAQSDTRPIEFALSQNYPNPFNPTTVLHFTLPQASRTNLTIYNVLGQVVKNLVDGDLPAGSHTIIWNGDNEAGHEVASGIYFYILEAGEFRAAEKMVLLR